MSLYEKAFAFTLWEAMELVRSESRIKLVMGEKASIQIVKIIKGL